MTDLERRLSARLHEEAAQLVPDTSVPRPLPWPTGRAASRWRAPVLAAAAVLVVAAGVTVAVQSHRSSPGTAATAAHASPVLTSGTPAFACTDTATLHAARVGMFRIGITADAFCVTADNSSGTGGSALRPSGALRSWVADGLGVAGVVDPSVDRVVWVPGGTDERSGTTLDLYSLGQINGFAVPIHSGGTLLLYSGTSEVAREQVPFPAAGPSAAATSYPPGQGPTPKPGTWPTNARGQTYGSSGQANAVTGEPDLIAAIATNGKTGYVLRTDMELPPPANPSEAVARNTAPPRTIPVYQSDGLTQIGVFIIGGTGPTALPSPGNVTSSTAATTTR
jgi:hypothetical protein